MSRGAARFACVAVAILWPAAVLALGPEELAERWRWRTFDREEGLPSGAISALGHDRDDYIYAGTDRGLVRYNGFTWTTLETAQPFDGGPVTRIVEAGGDVYAANRSEVWLARYGLELTRVLRGERMLLAAGPLSGVYAIDAGARVHYHLEKDVPTRIEESSPLPDAEVFDYAVDDRRVHWLATQDGPFRRDLRNRFRWQIDGDLGDLRGRACLRIFIVKRQVVPRAPAGASVPAGPASFEVWALFEGGPPQGAEPRARRLLAVRGEGGWRIVTVDPSGPSISDLVFDGAGSYVAVSEDGRVYLSADGAAWKPVPVLGVGSVALSGGVVDPHGYLWYRAGSAAIVRFDGGSRRWEHYHLGLNLPSNNVLSLAEAADGSVWAGTENGVYRYPPGPPAEPVVYRAAGTVPFRSIMGLAEDRTGKIWISSESFKGTYFFQEGSWHRFEPREGRPGEDLGIASHPIRRIVADRGGDLWFLSTERAQPSADGAGSASPGFLLYRYSASVYTLSTFRAMQLPYGPASDLLQAQDKSFWIATDQGLVHTSPGTTEELKLFTEAQGLRSERVWAIAEAGDGSIWVAYDPSVASGVSRIRGSQVETFDERNGLLSPNAWSVASSISPEGTDVWFGTDRGITRFDGECWYNYPIASLGPQESRVWPLAVGGGPAPEGGVEMESVLVGTIGHGIYRFRRDDRRRPRITLLESERSRNNVITFKWDGRDFKNETPPADLRFRIRVDDQPWTPFGPERSRSFAGLSPGEHTFQVEMRDLDGNANREKYVQHFQVPTVPVVVSPLALAAMAGAAGGLALVGLALVVLRGLARRKGPPGAALRAGRMHTAFPGAALVLDHEGRIIELTGATPEPLGLSGPLAREVLGRPAELLPLFQSPPACRALQQVLAGQPASLDAVPVAGGERFSSLRGFPILAEAGSGGSGKVEGAVVLVEEVTLARRSAQHLERARRLSALQDLASRIAAHLAGTGADGRPELLEILKRFAGEESGAREPLPLTDIVEGLVGRSLNGERPRPPLALPPGVDLDLRGQTGLWSVFGDRRAISLALLEVLRNAVDAMPGGGRLTVRVRNKRLSDDPGDLAAGPYVEVEIQDSGEGISAAELGRAFDPFFSTKPRDRARGVGLSLAYGVVRGHLGDIRIASTPGSGTTVSVLLPADPGA